MESVLGILFLVQFAAFIGIIIAEEIANKFKICYKDMIIKELEDEIKKLKKRRKK